MSNCQIWYDSSPVWFFAMLNRMSRFVLAITGPSGSGKSTIGEKLAKQLGQCVNIDADHVKHMIVSGFYRDKNNPAGWGFSQWGLVGDSIGLLAANFLSQNYDVIVNGYIDEPAWANIEKHISITHKILLLPELDTVKIRDASRNSEYVMGGESVTQHHNTFSKDNYYASFTKLDTTNHNIDETVKAIRDLLVSSIVG
jgi:hypothetical protein